VATTLHLLVPGLLGPWPLEDRADPAFPAPGLRRRWNGCWRARSVGPAPASADAALFRACSVCPRSD
jgi:hypothetical protein